jgi:Putative amidoligase enzyme
MKNTGILFQVRNLYTAAASFEKQIHAVFPASRVKRDGARPLSYSYQDEGDVYACAKRIEECRDYSSLLKSMGRRRETAYNISHLQEMDEKHGRPVYTYGTIEFRQHHGPIDADEISNWVQFVSGLKRLAHWAGEAGVPMSFLNRGKDKKMTFINLLDSLNMGKLKEHYAQPGKQYIQPQFYSWQVDLDSEGSSIPSYSSVEQDEEMKKRWEKESRRRVLESMLQSRRDSMV